MSKVFVTLEEKSIEKTLPTVDKDSLGMKPTQATLDEDLDEADAEEKARQSKKHEALLSSLALPEYAIKGSEAEWRAEEALANQRSKVPSMVSIKRKLSEPDANSRPKKKHKNDKEKEERKNKKH